MVNTRRAIFPLLAIAALLTTLLTHPSATSAASFTVQTTADAPHTTPLNGNCTSTLAGNPCTLRAAIQAVNFLGGGPHVITLATAGTYALTVAGANEDAAATGDLDVNVAVEIQNGSNGPITISAAGISDRVFDVGPTALGLLVLTGGTHGITVSGGLVSDDGAGIRVRPQSGLQANNLTVDGNIARSTGRSAFGGGIYNEGGLTLTNSTISNNRSIRRGRTAPGVVSPTRGQATPTSPT
jgi:CSLREA domain-containing protein